MWVRKIPLTIKAMKKIFFYSIIDQLIARAAGFFVVLLARKHPNRAGGARRHIKCRLANLFHAAFSAKYSLLLGLGLRAKRVITKIRARKFQILR